MQQTLPAGLNNTFLWSEELGYGWHTAPAMNYDSGYFAHYQKLDATPMGAALTKARVELVSKYSPSGSIVDIGIGGGRFVEDGRTMGYDVCPDAVRWLKDCGRWVNVYGEACQPIDAIACWDSLEHIPEPEKLLARVREWLFVSMPIYKDMNDVLTSKHYKPGEHLHYWTLAGFIAWCERQGFEVQEINHAEDELGREGITSFAFRRVVA